MAISVASSKVLVLWLRVTEYGMPGGHFTVAVCLSTKVKQEGSTCIDTASVPCAEVALAGTESNSKSAAYRCNAWKLNDGGLRVGVTPHSIAACAKASRGNRL
jgi:hypothetical protein